MDKGKWWHLAHSLMQLRYIEERSFVKERRKHILESTI
jgi:hypothetical protein